MLELGKIAHPHCLRVYKVNKNYQLVGFESKAVPYGVFNRIFHPYPLLRKRRGVMAVGLDVGAKSQNQALRLLQRTTKYRNIILSPNKTNKRKSDDCYKTVSIV